jgi:hypothetical protein
LVADDDELISFFLAPASQSLERFVGRSDRSNDDSDAWIGHVVSIVL